MHPLIIDLGREYRGGQHQALLLLRGLHSRGHAPELIALRDSQLAQHATDAGVSVHAVPAWRRRIAAASRIRRLLRERRADIVHANEPHALSAAWLARGHRAIPVVVSRRIALPLSSGSMALARYRSAARIIAVSHFVEQSVIHSGLPANRVSVIYDGVEIPPLDSPANREKARGQLGIPPAVPCVGNVAAFVPEKGHALLVRAFAELRKQVPECILLLRGEGPEKSAVQALAAELHVRDTIKFLGPAAEIESIFAALDIFAFPSHEEPLGSALLAAMAHGLPVVAIARGGIPEVIDNQKNGLLVDTLDPGAFSAAMTRLIMSVKEARLFGNAARETVATRFSADRMADVTLQLYEDLITAKI
jgi:glycosyltransferase involved in cell wall biosynthesis